MAPNGSPRLSRKFGAIAAAIILSQLFPGSGRAASAGAGRILFGDSVKEVPSAPTAPHRATLVRADLKPGETSASIEVEVALRMRNFAELQARVGRGERISRAEMEEKYFPQADGFRKVTAWLKSQGLTVTRADETRLAVFVSGSVDQVSRVFDVKFGRVALDGVEYTSATTAPSLPADIAAPVLGIHGLQPHLHPHRMSTKGVHRTRQLPETATYYPSQILSAYNANIPGATGAGQTIAVVGDGFPGEIDVNMFWTATGVSQNWNNINFVKVGGGPNNPAIE